MFDKPCHATNETRDRQQGSGRSPTDEEVDRLSCRISEVHAAIGRAHDSASEHVRTHGALPSGLTEGEPDPDDEQGDLLARLGPAAGFGRAGHFLYEAYTARGKARLARGEDDLAIIDFGMAIHFSPFTIKRHDPIYSDLTAEAWEGRDMARAGVALFLEMAEDPTTQAAKAPPVDIENFRIRRGYLVVGLDAVLIREPLTPEGRCAAIAHADRLARHADACAVFDEHYVVDSEEFDLFVYEYDGSRPTLIHQAAVQEDRAPRRRPGWR